MKNEVVNGENPRTVINESMHVVFINVMLGHVIGVSTLILLIQHGFASRIEASGCYRVYKFESEQYLCTRAPASLYIQSSSTCAGDCQLVSLLLTFTSNGMNEQYYQIIEAMTESDPAKQDEQFPLLMVSGGGGDGRATPKNLSSMWNVTSFTPRRSWFDRWPECLSTCWMTLVLLGITFLVFYAIGMVAYKREGFILVKCNENKTAQNVFMHRIVPRYSNSILFSSYADFIAHVANKYSNLQFNVIFLIEDTPAINYGLAFRHSSRFLLPRTTRPAMTLGEWEKREIIEFQRQHPNVNINTIPLSRYMSMTPLKHKWHMIPTYLLTFYARVYSVWQDSGIGLDLAEYNNQFVKKMGDIRLTNILRTHDSGIFTIPTSEPLKTGIFRSDRTEQEREGEFLKEVLGFLTRLANSSSLFFNKMNFTGPTPPDKANIDNIDLPKSAGDRMKRDTTGQATLTSDNSTSEKRLIMDLIPTGAGDVKNVYNFTTNDSNDTVKVVQLVYNSTGDNTVVNKSDAPEDLVILYDISVIVGGPMDSQNGRGESRKTGVVNIDTNGQFVAATSQYHPFLSQVLSAGCRKLAPRTAISDAFTSQCNEFAYVQDDYYCKNIHVL